MDVHRALPGARHQACPYTGMSSLNCHSSEVAISMWLISTQEAEVEGPCSLLPGSHNPLAMPVWALMSHRRVGGVREEMVLRLRGWLQREGRVGGRGYPCCWRPRILWEPWFKSRRHCQTAGIHERRECGRNIPLPHPLSSCCYFPELVMWQLAPGEPGRCPRQAWSLRAERARLGLGSLKWCT